MIGSRFVINSNRLRPAVNKHRLATAAIVSVAAVPMLGAASSTMSQVCVTCETQTTCIPLKSKYNNNVISRYQCW